MATDPGYKVTAAPTTSDVVLEGIAAQVTDETPPQQLAEAYRTKCRWPVTVADGAFDVPYGGCTSHYRF